MGIDLRFAPLEYNEQQNKFEMGGALTVNGADVSGGCAGKTWWVDGTKGSNSNDGLSASSAKKTITAGIAAQIAGTTGWGDMVKVLPGTYAEAVTGALTKCKLVGVLGPYCTIVAPTTTNGYVGTLTDSVISGITFRTPSSSSLTLAALCMPDMLGSVIDNCFLEGTTDPVDSSVGTCGIRIGAETATTWEQMLGSRISNCRFYHTGGRNNCLSFGISFGTFDETTCASTRVFRNSIICDNMIAAEFYGIWLQTGNSNNNGAVITRNFIHSTKGGFGGCDVGIRHTYGTDDDTMTLVTDNRISCANDAIECFRTENVQGNIVGVGTTPVGESPAT